VRPSCVEKRRAEKTRRAKVFALSQLVTLITPARLFPFFHYLSMAEPSQKAHITLSNIYFSSGLMLHPKLSKVLALVESRCPDLFVHHDPLPQPHYPLAEPIAHLSHSKTLCSGMLRTCVVLAFQWTCFCADHMRNQTDVVDQSESEELLIDKRLEIDRTNTDLNNLNSEVSAQIDFCLSTN